MDLWSHLPHLSSFPHETVVLEQPARGPRVIFRIRTSPPDEPLFVSHVEVVAKNATFTNAMRMQVMVCDEVRCTKEPDVGAATFSWPFPTFFEEVPLPMHLVRSGDQKSRPFLHIVVDIPDPDPDATIVFRARRTELAWNDWARSLQIHDRSIPGCVADFPLTRRYRLRSFDHGSCGIFDATSNAPLTREVVCRGCGESLQGHPVWQCPDDADHNLCDSCHDSRSGPGGRPKFRLMVFRDDFERLWDGPFADDDDEL